MEGVEHVRLQARGMAGECVATLLLQSNLTVRDAEEQLRRTLQMPALLLIQFVFEMNVLDPDATLHAIGLQNDSAVGVVFTRLPMQWNARLLPHQMVAVREAIRRNIILYAPTGGGRMLIAAQCADYYLSMKPAEKVCFCEPTFVLVSQVALFCRQLKNGRRVAELNGNNEDREAQWWQQTVAENQILVCTPHVLKSMLEHGFLSSAQLSFVVLDECHFAANSYHPFVQVSQNIIQTTTQNGVRILGLTAATPQPRHVDMLRAQRTMEANLHCASFLVPHP